MRNGHRLFNLRLVCLPLFTYDIAACSMARA
jgi:hypothetical protein